MKPLLASSTQPDIEQMKYPKYASTKLDGIRCIISGGKALSRSLKPIPNLHVQRTLAKFDLEDCDGELMVNGDFNDVQSAIMSVHGTPSFRYEVFDFVDSAKPFEDRISSAYYKVTRANSSIIKFLPQMQVNKPEDVEMLYAEAIYKGHEGLILKDPQGKYKFGRSTLKQEIMLKLKEVEDTEGVVIGFTELMHNNNDAFRDDVGNQVRSDHQAFKEGGDTLGALVVKFNDSIVNIGSGFDAGQRQFIWNSKEHYRGMPVKFKHLGLSKYGIPRCPVFLGFRHKDDM